MENKLILKNHLKEVRAERKLSQSQLAGLAGMSRSTVISIKTGWGWCNYEKYSDY